MPDDALAGLASFPDGLDDLNHCAAGGERFASGEHGPEHSGQCGPCQQESRSGALHWPFPETGREGPAWQRFRNRTGAETSEVKMLPCIAILLSVG